MPNQWIFNRVVFEVGANGRCLPLTKFPYGEMYFNLMRDDMRQNVVIVHNNWIHGRHDKIKRFLINGLWYEKIQVEILGMCTHTFIRDDSF